MNEPGSSSSSDQGMLWSQQLEPGTGVFATFLDENLPEAVCQSDLVDCSAASAYMSEAIGEGSALVDTAAQHGLIGEETLNKHDKLLQREFRLRVQVTNEDGGVRCRTGHQNCVHPRRAWVEGRGTQSSGGPRKRALPTARLPPYTARCCH